MRQMSSKCLPKLKVNLLPFISINQGKGIIKAYFVPDIRAD